MFRPLVLFSLLLCTTLAEALPIGVAKVDITPDYPIRLCGYVARKTQSVGVEQHILAKALAIGDDKDLTLLITIDNTAIPGAMIDEIAGRLKTKAGLARERFVVCCSHTHSSPCLTGGIPNIFGGPISAEEQTTIDKYTHETTDHLEQVALAAIADRKPGNLSWGTGHADFAINRRTPGGPVDHSLPILVVSDAQGQPRAILANYACHNTTLGGDFNKVCGDWAGYAQAEIEKRHPGVIAMISLGCAGDANPAPRGKIEHAKKHGEELADGVDQILAGKLEPLTEPLTTEFKRTSLAFEPLKRKDEWEALAKRPDAIGFNAKIQLEKLNRGEALSTEVPYVIETWTFGKQLAMVFLAGEVVVDYDLRLKHDYDSSRLWVSAYSNDVECYIPSKRILAEGGYEPDGSMTYYAKPARLAPGVENKIIETVREMLPVGFRSAQSLKEFPLPRSPEEERKAFHLRDDLKMDLAVAEPLVTSPVAIDWGLDGKMWVAEMNDYPNGLHENLTPGGQVKLLESSHHDGHYDKATVFLDGLRMPTGVMAWGKGVLICAAPDIIYAEDTKGTGKADVVKVLYTGFGPKNEQWLVNGLSWGLDNWIYGASSIANDPIHSNLTNQTIDLGNRDFRIHPDTGAFESAAGRTQFGRPTDDFGNAFGNDNSNLLWHYPLPEHYLRRNPAAVAPHNVLVPTGYDFNQLYPIAPPLARFNTPESAGRTTSACGPTIYRDTLLGPDFVGNFFGCEPANNLVYRLLLEPNGVTFKAHRAADEQHSEFLASTDNWSRPVQIRTGPDGALWVVDMYRYVIEHPRWITPDRMATLDIRAGSNMGRIWRIYPKDKSPQPIPDRGTASTADLAKMLDTSNGTVRDMIQRALVERQDSSVVSVLEAIAQTSSLPAVRLQALSALDGLHAVTPSLLAILLADPDAAVRRHAVRVSEPVLNSERVIAGAVARLASDPDKTVRFQVALSLGEWNQSPVAGPLSVLAASDLDDPWMRAAIVSSSGHCAKDLVEQIIDRKLPDSPARNGLIESLVATAAQDRFHSSELLKLLHSRDGYEPWQLRAIARILTAAEQRGGKFPDGLADAVASARHLAVAEDTPEPTRIAALTLLAHDDPPEPADLELLTNLLGPQASPALHSAAMAALARTHGSSAAKILLDRWRSSSPAQRTVILSVLITRVEWANALMDAIEKGKVQPGEVPVATRVRLASLHDDALHHRVDAFFATTRPSSRQEVLKQFDSVLMMKGDATRGSALFAKTCVACHLLSGQGHAVGPDLAALTDRSPRALMIAILDPNAAVDGKYVSYDLELHDGRSLSGIIEAESAGTVTLVQPTGLRDTIARTDITKLHSSGLSLMPEGLETGMSQQDLADLIEFVRVAKASKSP